MTVRKTKIVCTLGPTTEDPKVLRSLLEEGMNVARFNMAHGSLEYHAAMISRLREASRAAGIPVALLIDVKGPEVRTRGVSVKEGVPIRTGSEIAVTVENVPSTPETVSVTYTELPDQISAGKHILIADGIIDLEVLRVEGRLTRCIVRSGGTLGANKNVNIIGIKNTLPAVTEKDKANIRFAAEQDMDFVAASFVRKPEDVLEIRKILLDLGSGMHVISKIEDGEGMENIDGIIRVSDGVMIARGDLGVQLETEIIPLVQKRIILKCHDQNKAVITATQMLDSMINNPKPTRAEATDVANAVFDGTDAVMLSGETANGKHPVEAVRTMDRIALAVETSPEYESRVKRFFRMEDVGDDVAKAVTRSAYMTARDIKAAAILAPSLRGSTPKLISKYRPTAIVLAVTPSEAVLRKLLLYWGVIPLIGELVEDSDAMINNALQAALDRGYVQRFDKVVIVAGVPIQSPAPLNMIRVHFVGNVLNKGKRGFGGYVSGRIVKVIDALDAELRLKHDGSEIVLTKFLTPDFLPVLKGVRGVIIEQSSYIDPEAIKAKEPGIVVIAEVPDVVAKLEDGLTVTLHGDELTIYEGVMTRN